MLSSASAWLGNLVTETYGRNGRLSRRVTNTAVIFLATALLQYAFERYIFHCPQMNYLNFTLFCFIAPAIPLFLVGWLSNLDLQDAVRGLCHGFWMRENRTRTKLTIRWRSLIKAILRSHVAAYVAPFCWFLMCMLNGNFFTCARYGPYETANVTSAVYLNLHAKSQLIGFEMLLIGTLLLATCVAVKQCCKQVNPGISVCELQCLDNFASYEADAARIHFEQLMKKAAEENGRRKVELILNAYKPNLQNLTGLDKEVANMCYDHFTETRKSLMAVYPKIDNHTDERVQQFTLDEWEVESKIFQALVKTRGEAGKGNGDMAIDDVDLENGIEMSTVGSAESTEKAELLPQNV